MASLGVHTAVWTADWDAEGVEKAIREAAGVDAAFVEIPLGDPTRFDVRLTKTLLEEYGMRATCSVGLPDHAHAPVAPQEAIYFLEEAIGVVSELESDALTGEVYTHLGTFTGQPPRKGELVAVSGVLKEAALRAADRGISISVQPVNRFENYLLNTAKQADEMLDRIDEPNVFAHLDTFHMNIEEKGFEEPILLLGDRLRYVHLSESDRGTPGTGNVDWDRLFAALARVGFVERLVLESFVHPSSEMTRLAALWRDVAEDPEEPLREGLPFLRAKAEEYGLILGGRETM